jgi:hypothetical protein
VADFGLARLIRDDTYTGKKVIACTASVVVCRNFYFIFLFNFFSTFVIIFACLLLLSEEYLNVVDRFG